MAGGTRCQKIHLHNDIEAAGGSFALRCLPALSQHCCRPARRSRIDKAVVVTELAAMQHYNPGKSPAALQEIWNGMSLGDQDELVDNYKSARLAALTPKPAGHTIRMPYWGI